MISLNAYAKVNLCLYITGVRSDGYHLLDTVMQSISLCDNVSINKRQDNKINVTCDITKLSGEKNICYKAAQLFFLETGIKAGADIYIEKRIPLAAGLGGGSADAAAVLKGLNSAFNHPLSYTKLCEIALKLGADVPFCINGGTARVKGVGEDMESIVASLPVYILLVKEGEKPSTAFMYGEYDRKMSGIAKKSSSTSMCEALEKNDYNKFISSLYNDFSFLWDYKDLKQQLKSLGADGVEISGSGPTVMGFFKTREMRDNAYKTLKNKYCEIFCAESVNE